MPKLRLLIPFFLRRRKTTSVLTGAALSPLKSFVQDFLTAVRDIVRDFLSFFRGCNEDDARALLSAYGFCAFEVDHLQNNRSRDDFCRSPLLAFLKLASVIIERREAQHDLSLFS